MNCKNDTPGARPVHYLAISVVLMDDGTHVVRLQGGKPGSSSDEDTCYPSGQLPRALDGLRDAAADVTTRMAAHSAAYPRGQA